MYRLETLNLDNSGVSGAIPREGGRGFDSSDSSLVGPHFPDLMSYRRPLCSDYSFTKAFDHRLEENGDGEGAAAPANVPRTVPLWGRADSDGVPILEPAFVVGAPPTLPRAGDNTRSQG